MATLIAVVTKFLIDFCMFWRDFHTSLLQDYRALLLEAISQDTKIAERVSQPLV